MIKYFTLLLLLVTLQLRAQEKTVELFRIERNLNKNIVVYAANIDTKGVLDVKEPMRVYWVMNEEKGQRESLNFVERRMAYGFKCKKTKTPNVYNIKLVADKKRTFTLKQNGVSQPHIYTTINGQMLQLKTMKIEAENSGFMPKVKYIELIGINSKGNITKEKYIPNKK